MSYNDNDLPRSKVVMRGKTMVAWLPEATPPVLWRWVAGDVTVGFALRPADGKFELVSHDGGAHSQVIAAFVSEASAQRALAAMSRVLLSYKATWKKVVRAVLLILILLLVIAGMRLFEGYRALTALSQLQGLGAIAGRAAPAKSAAAGTPLLLPGMPPPGSSTKPAGPPTGSPVDVDSFYK